jgi:hypothetical protein
MKKGTPASPKFARCCHPRSPVASELTVCRRQSYPGRFAPIAVKAVMNSGAATTPHAT